MKILRLKEILDHKGISGKQIAADLGVTEATISKLSQGETIPRKDLLLSIADYLDVDIRELFSPTKNTPLKEYNFSVSLTPEQQAQLKEILNRE